VCTTGLESSPVGGALTGLRADEAGYYMNKYKHEFTVEPARASEDAIENVSRFPKEERDIVLAAKPLETARFQIENIKWWRFRVRHVEMSRRTAMQRICLSVLLLHQEGNR